MLMPPKGEDILASARHRISDLVHHDILTPIGSSYYYIAIHDLSLALCRFTRGTVAGLSEIIDHEVHGIHDDDLREAVSAQEPIPHHTGLFRLSARIEQILRSAHERQALD
jgi:hypothetical protein